MIEIRRTFDAGTGLTKVDELTGYAFSKESFAHTFVITKLVDGEAVPFDGQIQGRLLRADGVAVTMADPETGNVDSEGRGVITLSTECYEAPGRFLLLILETSATHTTCVYAARGQVLDASGQGEIIASEDAATIRDEIYTILGDLSSTIATAHLVALFARNVGAIEAEAHAYRETVDDIAARLDELNIQRLITPNMLSQNYWTATYADEDDEEPIARTLYGNVSRVYGSNRPYIRSLRLPTETTSTTEPEDKGDSCWQDGDGVWHVYKDQDEVRVSLVDLGDEGAIAESDGEVYRYALQYAITGVTSGYRNAEELVFNYGHDGYTMEVDGQTVTVPASGVLDLVEGETYTLSCWARLTQGDAAEVCLSYGANGRGYVPYHEAVNREYITVESTQWTRIWWPFVYHANATAAVPYRARVAVGVCRRWDATLQLCGFRLVHGGLYGSGTLDEVKAQIADLVARVTALEEAST